MSQRIPLAERFWARVRKTDTCWLWTGGTNGDGNGQLRVNGKRILAHRLAWELTNGPIPAGILVCHHCDVPLCCKPADLFVGTPADNTHDAMQKGRFIGRPPGRGHLHRLFTPREVSFIRNSILATKVLAARFHVCVETIRNVRARRTYASIVKEVSRGAAVTIQPPSSIRSGRATSSLAQTLTGVVPPKAGTVTTASTATPVAGRR